jgi:hypothetical protein
VRYSAQPHKHWRFRVYVRQHADAARVSGKVPRIEPWRVNAESALERCFVNTLKAKHRGAMDIAGAQIRVACAAVAVKGHARCAAHEERAPLTAVLAAGGWQL